ncbi:hypothetical protein ACFYXQ_43440 [Nocardia jiangxiensis]|uniref:Uncharacterized protein n=1 Tax=Nocardia jiangxiensis TaxID=282685 RepID=A0ABW6SHI8_9NOCA
MNIRRLFAVFRRNDRVEEKPTVQQRADRVARELGRTRRDNHRYRSRRGTGRVGDGYKAEDGGLDL